MAAISKHLTVFDMLKVQSLLGVTPQAERDAWFAKLVGLPAADAAALIKAELARRGG